MPRFSTPYDGKIAVFHVAGRFVNETTIDDIFQNLRQNCPNVTSIWIKTSDGTNWMGPKNPTKPDLAIRGTADVARWIEKARAFDLEVHAWCYLYGESPLVEADLVAQACNVGGLKSMVLDVEDGPNPDNYQGGPQAVTRFIERLRASISPDFHLGLCIMPLNNHPRDSHIAQWLPHIGSIHPMAYHKEFGKTPTAMIRETYAALQKFQKPIIPALQSYHLEPNEKGVLTAAETAVQEFGASGLSIFRWGDKLKPSYFPFVRQITVPQVQAPPPHEEPPVVVLPQAGAPVMETFEFTGQHVKDAFTTVAQFLRRDVNEMLAAAELTDLDLRLNEKYFGFAMTDLPGLTSEVMALLASAINFAPLPEVGVQPVKETFEFTCQQVKDAFTTVAQLLGRDVNEMLARAGLTDLDQRLNEKYFGFAMTDLPGLTSGVTALLESAMNGAPLVQPETPRVEDTFEFTGRQVKDAFKMVAGRIGRDVRALLASAELTDLDQRLDQPYTGFAISDLPGLTPFVKTMIDSVLNGAPLPSPASGRIAGKMRNQAVINVFQDAAIALDQGELYWNWAVAAGLTRMAVPDSVRRAPYNGPDIADLPNLTPEIILALLWAIEQTGPHDHVLPPEPDHDEDEVPIGDIPGAVSGSGAFLKVPWVSQLQPDEKLHACGPASMLMLALAYPNPKAASLTRMSAWITIEHNTFRSGLIDIMNNRLGLTVDKLPEGLSRAQGVNRIREFVQAGRPVIVLINYNKLLTDQPFKSNRHRLANGSLSGVTGHWWVVLGVEGSDFIVNDPLWKKHENDDRGGQELRVPAEKLKEAFDLRDGFLAISPRKVLQ